MRHVLLGPILLAWLALVGPVYAAAPPDWRTWLAELHADAARQGIREATLVRALDGLEPVAKILERDRNQSEFTMTAAEYLQKVVSDEKVQRGREMMKQHSDLLARIGAKYGVQPRFIVAIWGVETWYGKHTGQDPVVASLATLAYDRRRSAFFREQLIASLRMIDRGYIELEKMKGSWAGAMGQPQFIPTSYLAYAVDEDGDGSRDIWTSMDDVFASIANYLAKHGWTDQQTWGRPVQVPNTLRQQLRALSQGTESEERGLESWSAAGVRRIDGRALPHANLPTRLIAPDGITGEFYATYPNFRRILRYNPSHLYALAIGLLSDRIDDR
jgi:membrane-bound lytic murein transglycosylase B